jgi:hypothetical protein
MEALYSGVFLCCFSLQRADSFIPLSTFERVSLYAQIKCRLESHLEEKRSMSCNLQIVYTVYHNYFVVLKNLNFYTL